MPGCSPDRSPTPVAHGACGMSVRSSVPFEYGRHVQGRWDVVVIGAGAMGSAAAWLLARDGRSVLLLDRFPAGHHNGSSHGGSRIFRLAYEEPDYVRMAQAALPLWRELEADAGETLLDITGGVDHGNPASIGRTAAALESCGAPIERMTPAAAEERWPHLRFEGDVLFQPDAGRCRADATVAALHARAAAAGADVRVGQGAAALEDMLVDDRVRVRVNGDAHEATVAVVAAGAWASKVIAGRAARLRLSVLWQPVSPERLQQTMVGLLPRRLCMVS